MRYYLIAGEASGDLHGGNLIAALRREDPQAEFRFWGGDMMAAAASVAPVRHYKDGAVMGLGDVLASGFKLLGNIRKCRRDILQWEPDVVIPIDYPGFNMRIAAFCHRHGIKVFYYIAPKTWASRAYRNRKLKKVVDKLFIVFPFEIPYFSKKGIPFIYKGNPLIDAIYASPAMNCPRRDFLDRNGLPSDARYIAILPGSRKGEISRMMPVCMDVVRSFIRTDGYGDMHFLIAGAPARDMRDYKDHITDDLRDRVHVIFSDTYGVLHNSEAAVINSGTASLEAALIGTPQVVCWSTGAFSAFVARHLLHVLDNVKYISLGNLCLDKMAFREFIQEDFTAENVSAELHRLVEDEEYRNDMSASYTDIWTSLGGRGASASVAKSMIENLKQ